MGDTAIERFVCEWEDAVVAATDVGVVVCEDCLCNWGLNSGMITQEVEQTWKNDPVLGRLRRVPSFSLSLVEMADRERARSERG
jgi:hypothetical protein